METFLQHHKKELEYWKNQLNKKQYPQDLASARDLIDYQQSWVNKLEDNNNASKNSE